MGAGRPSAAGTWLALHWAGLLGAGSFERLLAATHPCLPAATACLQALAARIKALYHLCLIAEELCRLARSCNPQLQWPLPLRYRLACGAAFAIDAAPQLLATAWCGPHTTAALQQAAAVAAETVAPAMLAVLVDLLEEVLSIGQRGIAGWWKGKLRLRRAPCMLSRWHDGGHTAQGKAGMLCCGSRRQLARQQLLLQMLRLPLRRRWGLKTTQTARCASSCTQLLPRTPNFWRRCSA